MENPHPAAGCHRRALAQNERKVEVSSSCTGVQGDLVEVLVQVRWPVKEGIAKLSPTCSSAERGQGASLDNRGLVDLVSPLGCLDHEAVFIIGVPRSCRGIPSVAYCEI